MITSWRFRPGPVTHMLVVCMGMGILVSAGHGRSDACTLSQGHGGLIFPVDRVDPGWTCRLQAVIQNHTTESKVGPIRTALSESLYRHLLDHPPMTAVLIRRLRLGLYQSEVRGPGRFWGDDAEGTKGMVELVYEDPESRIYFLEGTHESRLLPHVSGKAVVFLRMGVVRDANGNEAMDSTLVAYTKLDNRFLSGLVSLLHPLVSRLVTSRLQKGVETVNRLGMTMNQDPQRVLLEAMKPPSVAEQHVAFLKEALRKNNADKAISRDRMTP
ncbi:MAG: hypothetical protein A4E19_01955 [Nitrospira sp. SG-bin1]|nr:MAG: hypothetical protein A4E19_01955 [Nitrospira sp. SG-bin1]